MRVDDRGSPVQAGAARASSPIERPESAAPVEILVAAFALVALLAAQWLLSSAIHGTNYDGGDGKMAQALILAALRFARFLGVTTISPIEGVGSQLLPLNVWANPAHWPFAWLPRQQATDLSALIALAIFAAACYAMARCFDVSVAASAVAAQLTIVLFAPVVLVLQLSTIFCISPDDAVVFAPHLVALGVLVRIEPGSWPSFARRTGLIFVLLLYSLYCDPLWTMVNGISWTTAFAVATLAPLRWRAILLRVAALACCVGLLLATGALEYLYSLSQYTARVQYAAALDRPRIGDLATALFFSPTAKYFYLTWIPGWVIGLLTLRGRPRVFVAAAAVSFAFLLFYVIAYIAMQNVIWLAPLPIYFEQNLFPLFMAAAVAGYWGALQWTGSFVGSHVAWVRLPAALVKWATTLAAVGIATVLPATAFDLVHHRWAPLAELYNEPWPNQPELERFLSDNIGAPAGEPFRGAVLFKQIDYDTHLTMSASWDRLVPTVTEYGQLITPQAVYFLYGMLHEDIRGTLNYWTFWPQHPLPGSPVERIERETDFAIFWRALQLLGGRYVASHAPVPLADTAGARLTTVPRRPSGQKPGEWLLYEMPHPNVGNYSPTDIVAAASAAETTALMRDPGFDFETKAVLVAPLGETLMPARDMRLSRIRGGLHVSGRSDGTSLVVLPQQFSHCLRARDDRVRLIRANLMMTGLVFSGPLDTDITFDYGIFSPRCRRADLADFRLLQMTIDLRLAHVANGTSLPGWTDMVARLRAAVKDVK